MISPVKSPAFWPALSCLALSAFGIPLLDHGARDLRMVAVFSLDEAAFAYAVRDLLRQGTFELHAFTYGSLYPYLGFLVLSLKQTIGEVSERDIVPMLRLICLAAGAASVLLTYRLARRAYGAWTGALASALLVASPLFLRWSVEAHPDMLQLVFVLCCLSAACRLACRFRYRDLMAAGLFAGLAFGTKYAGVFLLPTVGVAAVSGLRETPSARSFLAQFGRSRTWIACLITVAVFAATFAVTNPYAVRNWGDFVEALAFMRRVVSEAESGVGATAWFRGLLSPAGAGAIPGLAALAYVLLLIVRRWGELLLRGDRLCLVFWTASYLAYLVVSVNFTAPQYLLPVLPVLMVFASHVLLDLLRAVALPWPVSALLLAGVALFQVLPARPLFSARSRDEAGSPVIAAGLWLQETYPEETTILYDAYAYVPSKFRYAQTFFGQSYLLIHAFRPDLLIVRKSVQNRYRDLSDTSHFRLTEEGSGRMGFLYLHPQQFRDVHYTYAYLAAGHISDYRLVRDFDAVQIFAYAGPDSGKADVRLQAWLAAHRAYHGGGLDPVSAAAAYVAFGDLHARSSNFKEAKLQYRRAIEALPSYNLAYYGLGLVLAHQDSFTAAHRAFDRAAALTDNAALVYENLGWDYCRMGAYARSRQASGRAHEMAPDRPFPLFNLALAYLMEGQTGRADSVYAEAVERYGLPQETAHLLKALLGRPDVNRDVKDVVRSLLRSGYARRDCVRTEGDGRLRGENDD